MKAKNEIEFTSADDVRTHLVERRKDMGLSQSDIAKRMGVGQSYISVFEKGSRSKDPHFSSLEKYAKALGLEMSMVLADMESTPDITKV